MADSFEKAMIQRLQSAHSRYSTVQWAKEEKLRSSLIKNISRNGSNSTGAIVFEINNIRIKDGLSISITRCMMIAERIVERVAVWAD